MDPFWAPFSVAMGPFGRLGEGGPGQGMLKQTTVFDVSLRLHAIFKMSFEIRCCICLKPCLEDCNTFIYERLLSTRVANVACVALSQTCSGWWASFSAQRCCCEWTSFSAHLCTSGIHFLVEQPSELSIEEWNLVSGASKFPSCRCCSINVHVPTSFRCCGLRPVAHCKESSTDLEESRDLLQTRGFTLGDNVTHFL